VLSHHQSKEQASAGSHRLSRDAHKQAAIARSPGSIVRSLIWRAPKNDTFGGSISDQSTTLQEIRAGHSK
jgi:hypothetical protein